MPHTRRAFFGVAAGGLVLPAFAADDGARPLRLEEFFTGRTRGEGVFESDLAGIRRPFTVDATGRFDGRTLILTERIRYEDGVREVAVWRFDRTGDGRYDGQRTGVVGVVPIRSRDGGIEMSYVAEVKGTDGSPVKLRFADRLEWRGPNAVINTADVTFLGLPVGRVEVLFKR